MYYDHWIHGQGVDTGREFMVRLTSPRCIIAILLEGEETYEDANPSIDFVIAENAGQNIDNSAGETFIVTTWLDAPPTESEIDAILHEAADINEIYTQEAEQMDAAPSPAPAPEWRVNLKTKTAIHDNGLVFQFLENNDGTWEGKCANPDVLDKKIAGGELDESDCARMAREAGDAFFAALKNDPS